METNTNRSFIKIDKEALIYNYHYFQSINPNICMILKGNFMGHGAILCAKVLEEIGCSHFGVATMEEAIALRNANISGEILILGAVSINDLPIIHQYQLTIPLYSLAFINDFINSAYINLISVYLKVDTGMHRLGLVYEELNEVISLINNKPIHLLGLFSHLCTCDQKDQAMIEATNNQITCFKLCINLFEKNNYYFKSNHLLATNGALNYSNNNFDMLRIGMGLTGVLSSKDATFKQVPLKAILSFYSHIMQIRTLKKGEGLGYDYTFKASKDMLIGIVCAGFADGYPRSLANNAYVYVNGEYCKIIGNMCMDQMMIDLSTTNANVFDVVELIGEHISIYKIAAFLETSTVDVFTRLSYRLPRIIK